MTILEKIFYEFSQAPQENSSNSNNTWKRPNYPLHLPLSPSHETNWFSKGKDSSLIAYELLIWHTNFENQFVRM